MTPKTLNENRSAKPFQSDGDRPQARAIESSGRWLVSLANKSNGALTGFVSPYFDPGTFAKPIWSMSEIAAYGRAGKEPALYFSTESRARNIAAWWNDPNRTRSPYAPREWVL